MCRVAMVGLRLIGLCAGRARKGYVGRAAIIRGRRLRFRLAAHVAAEAVPRRAGIDRRRRLREDRLALVPLNFPSGRTAICHLRRLREVDRANRTGQRAAIRSEEHTSELQSLMRISYAVFCLKKKK